MFEKLMYYIKFKDGNKSNLTSIIAVKFPRASDDDKPAISSLAPAATCNDELLLLLRVIASDFVFSFTHTSMVIL
ncbi:hypothetical protein VNO78_26364 [Psophocarpus tetragonolobus]|uniref:Uncharacterized protein n=1 Tax=Psophocarpus tetragonolobus TaxID=3891 RepID=A0AAN9S1W5_PSOTE